MKKIRIIWNKFFEYDRKVERKIKKSISLWNDGGFINKARAMFMFNRIRRLYGCSVNPRVIIGKNLYIAHAQDIVIGQTTEIGDNCRIYPGVKCIARVKGDIELVKKRVRRHPKIGNNVVMGADCIIIGPIQIGDNVIIGAGAIVTKNVPEDSIVVGINDIRPKI